MPLIPKPNYNQIFASQAPDIDKPAVFNNYPGGWGPESRPNNGKPTIKGFNYLQQTSDLKDLWILQNGACLPYDESIEYAEGAPVLKDGVIQYKTPSGFSPAISEKPHITVESIADLLDIPSSKNGNLIFVKSYHAGLGKGGDLFHYVSSLSTVNNGVTVFNGWVRDTSDKLLTTDDAGLLGDGTDVNATVRLQNLCSAVDDGFTLQINGKYVTTTHLVVRNVDNLTITGVDGEIVGDKANWVFGSPLLTDIIPRGMIMGYRCQNINVNNLKIKGVQLNHTFSNADKWQDGDCAVHLVYCDHATVEKNDCSNTFAWSILIDQSNFPIVRDNKISDVTHQSGINCVIGQSDNNFASVYNNIIDNVGLYGIEWETYSGSLSMQCYNNTITNCYAGITVVSGMEYRGYIANNNIYASSVAGIFLINATNLDNNLNVTGNNISHSFRGILLQGSNGMLVSENKLLGSYKRQVYQKISAESFIVRIVSNNKFLIASGGVQPFGLGAGSVLSLDAKKTITITSVEDSSEVFVNAGPLKLITIAEKTLTDDDVFKHLHWIRASGGRGEAGIESEGAQKNIVISKNVVTDFAYTYQKQVGDSSDSSFNELVVDNVFSGAFFNSIMNLVPTKGIYYRGNTVSGGVSRLTREVIEGGYVDLKPLQTNVLNISRASGAAHPIATIGVFKNTNIVGIYVRPIGASTTGMMTVLINGTPYTHSTVGASARVIASERNVGAGDITIQLSDSVGDLVYSNVEVTLLTM